MKMTVARIKSAAGAMACESVRETEAIVRKNMLIVRTIMKEMNQKKKNAPGVRRRLTMKYKVMLNTMEFMILYGMSVSIEATASADG